MIQRITEPMCEPLGRAIARAVKESFQARRGRSMTLTPNTYRGFRIDYDPPPIPTRNCDWHWTHHDFDGPEDNRYGHAESEDAARAAVDEWIDESCDCRCSAPAPDECEALTCKYRRPA